MNGLLGGAIGIYGFAARIEPGAVKPVELFNREARELDWRDSSVRVHVRWSERDIRPGRPDDNAAAPEAAGVLRTGSGGDVGDGSSPHRWELAPSLALFVRSADGRLVIESRAPQVLFVVGVAVLNAFAGDA